MLTTNEALTNLQRKTGSNGADTRQEFHAVGSSLHRQAQSAGENVPQHRNWKVNEARLVKNGAGGVEVREDDVKALHR